jgi:hypothetical protein
VLTRALSYVSPVGIEHFSAGLPFEASSRPERVLRSIQYVIDRLYVPRSLHVEVS